MLIYGIINIFYIIAIRNAKLNYWVSYRLRDYLRKMKENYNVSNHRTKETVQLKTKIR